MKLMKQITKGLIASALCTGILFSRLQGSSAAEGGWQETVNGYKYLLEDGTYQTGWFQENGETYFFDKEGLMWTDTVKIGDLYYYFNTKEDGNEGAMQTGVVRIHGKLFLFDANGVCVESTYGKQMPIAYSTFDAEGNYISHIHMMREF
ncbi:MAG: hypothetical protein HFG39_00535 [Lachnospiraceae bacterium]|nr:hypothetical protein [Lachnospiraceae bacterium]